MIGLFITLRILFSLNKEVCMLLIYFLLLLHVFASVLNLHRWEYMHSPSENSKEAEILEVLRHPRDWVP